MALSKSERRTRIRRRIRKNVSGTAQKPRVAVFRSNKQIYAQVIDDVNGVTLLSASSLKNKDAQTISKIEQAVMVGKELGEKAVKAGITEAVFDRGGYRFHGRVKHLADAAREAGLKL